MKKKILILNGSLGEEKGNTSYVLDHSLRKIREKNAEGEIYHLKNFLSSPTIAEKENLKNKIENADGFIFSSGTYWDSWGSPMQFFLEMATEFEASSLFFAKPAAVIITMHSVGGKGVLSRLQGVLNTMGFLLPPMSGMVYALVTQLALENKNSFSEDFWSLDDVDTVVHNLLVAINQTTNYQAWPVDHKDPTRLWIKKE